MEKKSLFLASIVVLLASTSLAGLAFAQTSNTVAQDTQALITAFGALLGSVGGIIVAVVGFLSNNNKHSGNSKEIRNSYDDLLRVGVSLKQTDEWIFQNQHKLAQVVAALSESDPKIKDSLKGRSLEINELTKDLDDTRKELDTVYAYVIPRVDLPERLRSRG